MGKWPFTTPNLFQPTSVRKSHYFSTSTHLNSLELTTTNIGTNFFLKFFLEKFSSQIFLEIFFAKFFKKNYRKKKFKNKYFLKKI